MHPLDLIVLVLYFIGITWYGLWVSRRTSTTEAYFRGNRKFKWWTMMGQAFGTGTHAEMPVAQAGVSYSGGFSTIWYQWKNLLITPFYWLMAPWYRRSRRTTVAELVRDRYGSLVGLMYTVFAIFFFVFNMGSMLQGAAKVISIASGEVISSNWIVVIMTVVFIVYSFFGGLVAAAHTEFVQGLLIIILSFMLIPAGLHQIGGFTDMRSVLPPDFFELLTSKSGLGGFTIAMLALNGIVGITAQPHMMTMFATGENELVSRAGQTYGNFIKRLVTIGWVLTGMITAALVIKTGVTLGDPEHAFGYATRTLLSPGLVGLMMACILAANMSTASNFMVNLGALFVKDIYQPYLKPQASDQDLLVAGKFAGLGLTFIGIAFALSIKSVLSAFLFTETVAAFMGIIVFGGFLWKRGNRYGAITAVAAAFLIYYVQNYLHEEQLLLVYKWRPEPFGIALLVGFLVYVTVSLLTKPEPSAALEDFFQRMQTHSDGDGQQVDRELILLDVSTWFTVRRWANFSVRYRTEWWGFVIAWLTVAALIFIAWIILYLGQ